MGDFSTTRHLGPLERMDDRSARSAPLATAHLSMYPIQAFHTFEFGSHTSFLVRGNTEPTVADLPRLRLALCRPIPSIETTELSSVDYREHLACWR